MKNYVKRYGFDVELRLTLNEDSVVIKSEVLYNNGSWFRDQLVLGFGVNGDKTVDSSTTFSNQRDWVILKDILEAQTDAFYFHGELFGEVDASLDFVEIK